MNSVRIEPWGIRFDTPKRWEEAGPRLYVRLLQALRFPDVNLRKVVIMMLLVRPSILRPRLWFVFWLRLNAGHRHALAQLAEPFLEVKANPATMIDKLRPRWSLRRLRVAMPDLLNELDIYNWTMADTWFMRWRKSKDPADLHAMVSMLYTPKGMTRAERLRGGSLPMVKRVPSAWLVAVGANWGTMRMVVEKQCPHLFSDGKEKGKPAVWGDVLRGSAGNKFGTYQETCLAPAYAYLLEENQRICDLKNMAHKKNGKR
jgi:hypothetical protein